MLFISIMVGETLIPSSEGTAICLFLTDSSLKPSKISMLQFEKN